MGAQPTTRASWLDTIKGIGILLVVWGHVARGLANAGLPLTAWEYVDYLIYSFHMPLFFFASGLLATRLTRHDAGNFLQTRFWTIIYPYLIWSILQITVNYAARGSVNDPASLSSATAILYKPYGQFWFLYALFICQCVGYLLFSGRTLAGTACALFIWIFPPAPIFKIAFQYLPFYLLAPVLLERIANWKPSFWWGLTGPLFLALASVNYILDASHLGSLGYVTASCGIIATIWLVRTLHNRPATLLAWAGTLSMPIYVMHIIFGSGARVIMAHVGFPALPWAYAIITFAVGVAAPIVVYMSMSRLNVLPLFGLAAPKWAQQRIAKSAHTTS